MTDFQEIYNKWRSELGEGESVDTLHVSVFKALNAALAHESLVTRDEVFDLPLINSQFYTLLSDSTGIHKLPFTLDVVDNLKPALPLELPYGRVELVEGAALIRGRGKPPPPRKGQASTSKINRP